MTVSRRAFLGGLLVAALAAIARIVPWAMGADEDSLEERMRADFENGRWVWREGCLISETEARLHDESGAGGTSA
jgi:hypothetical protein